MTGRSWYYVGYPWRCQMGKSWRIGIDTENKTDLVEKGLFTVSRNPIFFGMRMALFGFFLSLQGDYGDDALTRHKVSGVLLSFLCYFVVLLYQQKN